MATDEIHDLKMQFAREHGVTPPLDYRGFPKSICTSASPARESSPKGDIIGVDVTLIVEGYHGDTATTIPVGEVAPEVERLLERAVECQRRGPSGWIDWARSRRPRTRAQRPSVAVWATHHCSLDQPDGIR